MVSTATIQGGSNFASGRSMSSNSTQFMPGGANTHFTAASSTESNNQMITRAAGDFSRIGIRVITADATGTATYRFRKDTGGGGANGNNAATLTTATTGWFQDATPHNDTVADGDKICVAIQAASLSVGITYTTNSMKFLLTASGAATYYGIYAPDSVGTFSITSSNSVTRDFAIPMSGGNGGPQGPNTENANQRQKLRTQGVITHLHTKITGSNAVAANATCLYRFNNTDGNNAATITASSTGTFEDTSNSDTVNTSDVSVIVWRLPITGPSTMNGPRSAFCKFVPSTHGFDMLASNSTSADGSGSTVADNFYAIYGNATRHTSETNCKTKIPLSITLAFMRCYVAVSQTGSLTLDLRKNGAAVNQTKTLTSATTGIFEDAVNTDTINDGDDLNYKHGAMVSTAGFWISWFGLGGDPGSGITPGNGSEIHHYNSVILG